MVGGKPAKDAYGSWDWTMPGIFAEPSIRQINGFVARFEGFVACPWSAALTLVGPVYNAMVAAETKHPRVNIKIVLTAMYWRIVAFFAMGAVCVCVHPCAVGR